MKLSKEQQEALSSLKKAFGFKAVVINGLTIDNISLTMSDGFASPTEGIGFMEVELHRVKNSITANTMAAVPEEIAKRVGLDVN